MQRTGRRRHRQTPPPPGVAPLRLPFQLACLPSHHCPAPAYLPLPLQCADKAKSCGAKECNTQCVDFADTAVSWTVLHERLLATPAAEGPALQPLSAFVRTALQPTCRFFTRLAAFPPDGPPTLTLPTPPFLRSLGCRQCRSWPTNAPARAWMCSSTSELPCAAGCVLICGCPRSLAASQWGMLSGGRAPGQLVAAVHHQPPASLACAPDQRCPGLPSLSAACLPPTVALLPPPPSAGILGSHKAEETGPLKGGSSARAEEGPFCALARCLLDAQGRSPKVRPAQPAAALPGSGHAVLHSGHAVLVLRPQSLPNVDGC